MLFTVEDRLTTVYTKQIEIMEKSNAGAKKATTCMGRPRKTRPQEHDLQITVEGGDALWFSYEDSAHTTGEVQCTIKIPNRLLLKWANVKDKNYIALANTSIKDKIILLNEKSERLEKLLGLTVIKAEKNAKVTGRKARNFPWKVFTRLHSEGRDPTSQQQHSGEPRSWRY